MKTGRVILIAAILLLGLAPGSGESNFGSGPSIGHYTVVESKTIPGYTILTFRAQLTNPLPYAITEVSATLSCRTVGATVIDGTLTFPDAEAGATVTSLTTFTLRLPKSRPFDASHLEWSIHFKKRNRTPVADAGPDQTVAIGAHVTLDGSGSRDPDGDALKFFWHFVSKPAGSYAILSNPYAVRPTFITDRSGIYVLELVVSDRAAKSAPDRVQVTTGGVVNTRPVANAGIDQTVAVGTLVQLDGSGSTDADGDALTFKWRLVSTPPQSVATLSDPTVLRPTLRIDRTGTYVAELVVNDGRLDSVADTVQVSTVNSRPIAVAGADQTVGHGAMVQLDGRASTDVDNDPLTFLWSFVTRPQGSQATLNDPASSTPAFIADLPGRYEVRLTVNDGFADSTPDTVQIDTVNSRPVADAGPDQDVAVGATVHLDGTASSDADGDPLTFRWSFTTRPDGSGAAFDDPATAQPSFVADRAGDYVAQLIVNDGFEDGLADTVVVTATAGNRPPVADAGPDQTVTTGTIVQLDGSGSSDPDGTPIASYAWTLTRPNSSVATLSNATIAKPTFAADRAGTYTAQLIVSDGSLSSAPDSVTITVTDAADLRIAFVNPPTTPGIASSVSLVVEVANAGPSAASGVTARFQVPAGYTVTSSAPDANAGTYDVATGVWTIGAVPTSAAVRLTVAATVKPTGPYDLTATITASTPNDPNTANNTATASVVPNGSADLGIAFASVPTTPAIGASVSIAVEIVNGGPAGTTGVTARFKPPAGYTVTGSSTTASSGSGGTYDVASGNWTIGAMAAAGLARLTVTATVNATGPYDLAASITGSAQPDPNPANNSANASVVLGGAPADLDIAFLSQPTNPPVGGIASPSGIFVRVLNNGPASATDVTARFPLPAGYTVRSVSVGRGTYDITTGKWTIGSLPTGAFANLAIDAFVNATGPYDLTATITGSSQPDPNPANNTATAVVTPNRNADLSVAFLSAPINPPVGGLASPSGIFVRVLNEGPASTTGVTARFPLPAGYTIRSTSLNRGTYDPTTGNWTIGDLGSGDFANLSFDAFVNATGPYDLTATITGSSGIDPNPTNNTVTVVVTPNRNADLQLSIFSPPSGTIAPGAPAGPFGISLEARNGGPASTTGVVVSIPIPSGYRIVGGGPQIGTYDAATGAWVIGALPSGVVARLGLDARVNATGPTGLTATVIASDQPDPDLTNNTVIVPPINRPPVANAGADQSVSTNTTAQLDGRGSSDADGDALTFQWSFALRPVNSTTVLVGATTATPTFVPDLGGTYRAQLVVTDVRGAASAPSITTILASVDNHPPVIRSSPVTAATVGLGYRYAVDAADPDAGSVLTFSLPTAPAGMTIGADTGIVRWTPVDAQAGPQPVIVRVQDQRGLFATQAFEVQVSSAANRAPVAADDAYTVRLGESLGVGAPGVLANDSDANGTPLTAVLLTAPTNGALAFNPDGSFTYTPHGLQAGELVLGDDVDLVRAIPGTTFNMNGDPGVVGPPCERTACAFDDNIGTMTSTLGLTPATFEVVFPQDVTVNQVRVVAGRHPQANRPTSGIFRLLAADGRVLHDSSNVEFPLPDRDATLVLPGLAGVRRVQVSPLTGERGIFEINLAEVKVIGSALIRRGRTPERNLAQLLPATVQAGSFVGFNVPESVIDDSAGTSWYAANGPGDFIEISFPVDVTVTGIETLNPGASPDGFGSSLPILCHGTFQLLDAGRTVLFDSGIVATPFNDRGIGPSLFTLPVPTTPGVRSARYTVGSCAGSAFPAGFSEIRVLGTAPVSTPAFQLTKKFQALAGREVHSTPVVANLTDDNGDGVIDTRDIPDIVVPVESLGNQLTGDLKIISGDDGRELFTLGVGLVSPWSEVAVADIDGDGVPDIIAVHSDGNHLIAFDLAGGTVQGDLTQVLRPVTVNVSSSSSQFQSAGGVDDRLDTIWMTANGDAANLGTHPFFEVEFRQDVTVTQVQLFGNRGFPGDNFRFHAGVFQLFAANGAVLLDSGVVTLALPDRDFTLAVPSAAGVRRVRFTGTDDAGSSVGLSELRVFGSATIATGTPRVKWISDPNPMPKFFIGNSALVGGAVSIANLDGGPRPHIIVGASVFDADGRLLGDGRTLGGTTGGNGLRSAISAVVDLNLDGRPAIVAGPTAYRLVNGQLQIAWQRKDLPDGYVAIGNFDDDPFPEIVIVADGKIYMLNHDGTDAEVWNPPTHGPVATPGAPEGAAGPANGQSGAPLIVDVDGDGIPEIGIAKAANYLLYNRDGSLRWKAAISDRSSHSTGSVAFDFDGDGAVEIVYRDEQFLRIFRGADGVLLAKVPVQSATWAEQPVVVDVDNDGHADIIVTSDFSSGFAGDTGVFVFRDVANKWTRTRRIWNQHSYHVTNVNEDGSIPRVEQPHWLVPGLNSFRTNAFVPGESADASDRFTYVATDGVLDSNVATVRIAVNTPNSPPRFTSSAVTTAATGVRYIYAARATDPDAGDVLTFSLPTAPTGMTIEPSTGLVQWTPTAAQLGSQAVVVKVHDARGLFALQSYSVQVAAPVTVPNVVGQPQATAQTTITNATLSVGSVGTHTSATVTSGAVISQNPSAGTLAAPGTSVSLVVSLGPPPTGAVPDVVGQPQSSAQADITAAGFVLGPIVSLHSAVVPLGVVISQNPSAGTAATAGSAVNLVVSLGLPPGDVDLDRDGFTGNQGDCDDTNASINPNAIDIAADGIDQNCNGRDSIAGDTTPPTVSIDAPADLAVVTMPLDIIGTATDANFLRYTLDLVRDSAPPVVIGSGTAPVIGGVLGRLDPTLLENGLYRVRLTAQDVNRQVSVIERAYRVDGLAKVGNFRLSFTDLSIAVAGVPLAIVRTYDSRVKSQEDFGIGWTLDVKRGFYEHNRTPGEGWQILPSGIPSLPCRSISETATHLTQVRLSDYESYTFALTLSSPFALAGGCQATASFRFVDGRRPGATLEILDGTDVFYLNGDSQVVYQDTFLGYNPSKVRLTTADGRIFDLERGVGITRIQDLNANTLTITSGGIVHSSGKSVAFARDAAGRITRITDPNGNTLNYRYNGDGDLATFVDQASNQTAFTYDPQHNLLQILDPLGRRSIRTEYDDSGRLIATIDANGNRLAIRHDLEARQEVMTDRLGHPSVVEYDVRGNVVRQTDALGNVTTRTYDSRDNQLSVTDSLGATSTFTYDGADNLLTQIDALGNTTRYTYNSRNQELTRTDPLGGTVSQAYDRNGNLLALTDPLGNVTRYTYDDRGNTLTTVDALGHTRAFEYDGAGNQVRATDALGRITTHAYDANSNRVIEVKTRTSPNGSLEQVRKQYEYDGLNRLVQASQPDGSSTRLTYNAVGRPATIADPLRRQTTHTYDDRGNLTLTTYPDGTTVNSTYDAEGREITATDQAGRTTSYQLDARGQVTMVTYPDGATTRSAYDGAGRVVATTDARGNTSSYEYDAAGRRTKITDALGNVTASTYDRNGRTVKVADARGNTTSFEYDAAGRRTRVVYPDGSDEQTSYDALGRAIARTDPLGRTTSFAHDAVGQLTNVTDAAGQVTTYTYDELGNRVTQTDADGRTTRLRYDTLGRRTKRILPLGQEETFVYDLSGKVASRTDFDGKTTAYRYDSLNRLIGKTPNLSLGEPPVTFTYSATGRRTSMADGSGVTTYAYDARDRLVTKTTPRGTLSYSYDPTGNVAAIRSSNGNGTAVDYIYDALNRLASAIDRRLPAGHNTTIYDYDANGNLSQRAYPNGVISSHTHDRLNRPTRISVTSAGTTLADYAHAFDHGGNRVSVVELSGRTVGYTYDPLNRLTAEVITGDPAGSNGTLGYTYDAVGNRLARTSSLAAVPPVPHAYDANDRLTNDPYDDNGNTTAVDGAALAYDFENRVTSVNGDAVSFVYDGDGHRVGKTVNGIRTEYLVDDRNPTGYAQVVEEIVGGAVERVYTYGLGLTHQQSRDGSIRFFHQDGQGSVRFLTDATASRTDTYDYEAFGALLRSTGSTANNYRFRSEQFDASLNSYYLRARYYRPDTGRFLTADSWSGDITTPGTLHRYAYTSNNPVMYADPSGHFGLAEAGATVGISSILAGLPSVTPSPQSVRTGGPLKTVVVNVVLWPTGGDALVFQQFTTANFIYATNGGKIRIEAGLAMRLDEDEGARIVGPSNPEQLDAGVEGLTRALRPALEEEKLIKVNRTLGRITIYYVPDIVEDRRTPDNGLTIESGKLGQEDSSVFISIKRALDSTLAHELGHAIAQLDDLKDDPSRLMYNRGPRTGHRLIQKEIDAIARSPYLSP